MDIFGAILDDQENNNTDSDAAIVYKDIKERTNKIKEIDNLR